MQKRLWLKQLIDASYNTQNDLAKAVGYSGAMISIVVSGKRAPGKKLRTLLEQHLNFVWSDYEPEAETPEEVPIAEQEGAVLNLLPAELRQRYASLVQFLAEATDVDNIYRLGFERDQIMKLVAGATEPVQIKAADKSVCMSCRAEFMQYELVFIDEDNITVGTCCLNDEYLEVVKYRLTPAIARKDQIPNACEFDEDQPETVQWTLLPPPPDVCQQCAVDHDPLMPHNNSSLHWQYWFYGRNGRWPKWTDAMEHCTDDVKEQWVEALATHGVVVEMPEKGEQVHE